MRSRPIAVFVIITMLSLATLAVLPGTASADDWEISMTGGFTGDFEPAQPRAGAAAVYNTGSGDQLYVGTKNRSTGCRVYRYDGGGWSRVNDDGFGNPMNTEVTSMVVYNGRLYAGTRNEVSGCEVWRYGGGDWTRMGFLGGFGDRNNVEASSLATYGGNLYAGTENDTSQGGNGCEVWRYTGLVWVQVNANGFGFTNNMKVTSMTSFNGALVAGTRNSGTGCHLWRYDGSSWNAVNTSGFGSLQNVAASSMATYNSGSGDRLYVGTRNEPGGCELWELYGGWGSLTLNRIVSAGFGAWWYNHEISSMTVPNGWGGKLFMGTSCSWPGFNGCEVWTYDGTTTALSIGGGFGDPLNQGAVSAAGANGSVYFGTLNDPEGNNMDMGTGCEVWRFTDGPGWSQMNLNGFTGSNNYKIASMISDGTDIYAGTASAIGCEVWANDGHGWDRTSLNGFGDRNNSAVSSLALYDDGGGTDLYAGTFNPSGCQLWRFDGPDPGDWTRVSSGADIETPANRSISSMIVEPGSNLIHVGTYSVMGGCEIWTFDGAAWTQLVGSRPGALLAPGFGNPENRRASSVCLAGGALYWGTHNWSTGCEAWRFTPPGTFEQSVGNGFGDRDHNDLSSMAVFNGNLFGGTTNWNRGCAVFSHDPSVLGGWNRVSDDGFGDDQQIAGSMATSDTRLFVGTSYNGQVWSSRTADGGESWSQANYDGWLLPGNNQVPAMTSVPRGLGRVVYAGSMNTDYGAAIMATAPSIDSVSPPVGVQGRTMDITVIGTGTHFTPGQSRLVFDPATGIAVRSMYVVGAEEIRATISVSDVAPVGPRDVNVLTPGETPGELTAGFTVVAPGVPRIASVAPRGAAQGSRLTVNVVGQNTHFVQGRSRVTFSGSGIKVNSTRVTDVSHASADITVTNGAAVGSRTVNVITDNETPVPMQEAFTVTYGPRQAWYLAEGCTANGFETWVLVQNPGKAAANVSLTFMTPNGPVAGPTAELGAGSRRTFNVAETVPDQTDVSTRVTADNPVVVERAMYGNSRGWADDSIGIWAPAKSWYLAEGSTGPGFTTWILLQNPSASQATVRLTYMTPEGAVDGPRVTMNANTRKSFNVSNTCPGEWEVSTRVTSDQPVVAERAIYGDGGAWATESIGTAQPSTSWFLAEGSTGPGFETWVLVQNPGKNTADVELAFMTPEGRVAGPKLKLAPASRTTLNLADAVPGRWSVSTQVTSSEPVVAERAMYGNNRQWAHDSIGATAPAETWCLAEGSTGPGFETWVLVQNPNDKEARVDLTFMTPDSTRQGPSVVLPAHSRRTFNVADSLPDVWEVSTRVTSSRPVIAERAVYGSDRLWGHESIGCPW